MFTATPETTVPDQPERVEILNDMLTTADLMSAFDRSEITISIWRARKGLPYVRIKGTSRDTIRYRKAEVLAWANENDKEHALRNGSARRVRVQA